MARRSHASALLFLLLAPGAVAAQAVSAHYTVTGAGGKVKFASSPNDTDPAEAVSLKEGASFQLTIACTSGARCDNLKAKLLSGTDTAGIEARTPKLKPDTSVWEFQSDQLANRVALNLRIYSGTQALRDIKLQPPAPVKPKQPRATGDTTVESVPTSSLSALVAADCSDVLAQEMLDLKYPYSGAGNRAHFLVAANGNVAVRPPPLVDENDEVEVTVVAHRDLVPRLKVRRSSGFRTPGALNILGANATIPGVSGLKAGGETTCTSVTFALGDFQPGRGEVTISAFGDKGDVPTGSFEFGVNTLYSGAFSFGAIRTELKDPVFGLVGAGADSVVSIVEDDKPRVLYTLTYTPFIWGKRDLEKEAPAFSLQRFNPMFGIVLNDVKNNFVVGVSYDLLTSVYLTAGAHWARVHALNTDGGLALGSHFTGKSSQIPTVKHWDSGFFVGVSLDLRAATQFFQKAMSSTTPQS